VLEPHHSRNQPPPTDPNQVRKASNTAQTGFMDEGDSVVFLQTAVKLPARQKMLYLE
jgi:hypothetical protein